MREGLRDRVVAALSRARRVEQRELREFRRWVERTDVLVHLSILVFVPVLVAVVTALSNAVDRLSFLLFPPLAAGAYTLFADPEGRYASPTKFVAGLTVGALCGWGALVVATALGLPEGPGDAIFAVGAVEAALAVFATGAVTWAFEIEEPAAYATALLALLVPEGQEPAFALSVVLASSIVALVFAVWRERFYERRAQILYETTRGDDHVLVPMRGENPHATAMLAARLAAAHDAGKVVLLDMVADADVEAAAERLESRAAEIETHVGVPCEVVVAASAGSAATVLKTARETNCDLIAAAYEQRHGALSPYLQSLFRGEVDVLVHRSADGRTRWGRVLVPVRGASDVAHSMLDFAGRLTGQDGHVSVATCVSGDRSRRRGEAMLADLVEAFDGGFETRVSTLSIERFLAETAGGFDLVVMGASRDRSAASRLVSPPTFERIQALDADVAIVDRN